MARLAVAPELLERAAEAEQREAVRRGVLDDCLELRGGGLVLLRAEERPAERLADRGLVGSEVRGPPQGHCGGVVVALLEQLRPGWEEAEAVAIPPQLKGGARRTAGLSGTGAAAPGPTAPGGGGGGRG